VGGSGARAFGTEGDFAAEVVFGIGTPWIIRSETLGVRPLDAQRELAYERQAIELVPLY
jgi:hypothetical protein